ncbi:MAG: hypothetical protein ABIF04_01555 [Chloroflexota bacterium]
MKSTNVFAKFIVITSVLAALILASTIPASAGSNGQQISIYACKADRISIRGYNQNGQAQTKTFDKSTDSCGWYNITGWWWKGPVSVYAYYYVTPEYPYYFGQNVRVQIPTSQSNNDWVSVNVPTPTTRQWMVWRAATWVTDSVPYNNQKYHDGYRQDCSGYVSFAWSLPTSYSGDNWRSFAYQINFDNLQPGDVLDNPQKGDLGHMILFVGWVDKSVGSFTGSEENGWYGYTRKSTFTLNKSTGVVREGSYTYPGNYIAITKK